MTEGGGEGWTKAANRAALGSGIAVLGGLLHGVYHGSQTGAYLPRAQQFALTSKAALTYAAKYGVFATGFSGLTLASKLWIGDSLVPNVLSAMAAGAICGAI